MCWLESAINVHTIQFDFLSFISSDERKSKSFSFKTLTVFLLSEDTVDTMSTSQVNNSASIDNRHFRFLRFEILTEVQSIASRTYRIHLLVLEELNREDMPIIDERFFGALSTCSLYSVSSLNIASCIASVIHRTSSQRLKSRATPKAYRHPHGRKKRRATQLSAERQAFSTIHEDRWTAAKCATPFAQAFSTDDAISLPINVWQPDHNSEEPVSAGMQVG